MANASLACGRGRLMKEEWRDIDGYIGYYQVSNLGRVRGVDRVT